MIRLPPRSTRPDTLFPYSTLFRLWRLIGRAKGKRLRSFSGGVPKAPHWMVLTASWPRCPIGLPNPATNCPKAGRPIGSGTTGYEGDFHPPRPKHRSEEHTSELQSRMCNSYAVFLLQTINRLIQVLYTITIQHS